MSGLLALLPVGMRTFEMSFICPIEYRVVALEKNEKRQRRLAKIIFDSDLVATRVTLAIAELLWALTLLWPGETFARPTYALMANLASENVWGLTFLLTSWMQWSLVLIGDFKCIFARMFAAWNFTLWALVVVTMYSSVYPPPAAISGEAALALGAFWIFARPFFIEEK